MQKEAKHFYTAFCLSLFFALVLTAIRAVLLVKYIEPETGLYIYGTNAGFYFNGLIAVVLLSIAALCLPLTRAALLIDSPAHRSLSVFASSFCGFMFLSVMLTQIVEVANARTGSFMAVLQIVLCLPAAAYFLMISAKKNRSRPITLSLLAAAPIFYTAIRLIALFLDTNRAINSSSRSLTILSLCSMMLFFLCEARGFLPDAPGKKAKENAFQFFVFGLFTVALTAAAAIPSFCLSAYWILEAEHSYAQSVLDLSILLYALSGLVSQMDRRERKRM